MDYFEILFTIIASGQDLGPSAITVFECYEFEE